MFNPNDNLPCLQVFAHFPTDIDPSSAVRLEEQKHVHERLLRQLESKYSTLKNVTATDSQVESPFDYPIDYRNHCYDLCDNT